MSLFINLRHPRDFTSHTPRRGTLHILYRYYYVRIYIAHRHFFLCRPRVFSRVLGSGTRREPSRTPRPKCGPWKRPVARALGVQSHENWQVTTGRHFRARRAIQAHANPHVYKNFRQVSHAVLLTARTDCLATSCSYSCSSARALARACASYVERSKPRKFSLFSFLLCSV